ncbi:hypothetical protein ACOZCG_29350, partial [Streptomyces pseudogriseolus]|uniref:hypothetical protein n=1 Tax=Streptomyces pseudogriseolus TaxID=36817 RepID=UPI003FA2167E
MAPIPTPPTEPSDSPDAYVGLAADRAEHLARERGWSSVRALAPGTIVTMTLYPTRKELHRSAGRKRLPEMQPVNRHSEPRR